MTIRVSRKHFILRNPELGLIDLWGSIVMLSRAAAVWHISVQIAGIQEHFSLRHVARLFAALRRKLLASI